MHPGNSNNIGFSLEKCLVIVTVVVRLVGMTFCSKAVAMHQLQQFTAGVVNFCLGDVFASRLHL